MLIGTIILSIFFVLWVVLLLFVRWMILYKKPIATNPVDIVITWVDDNQEFLREKNKWSRKEKIRNKNKDEDRNRFKNYDELRYCLRSIEKNFNDYRFIYIVVKDGQFPGWLKKKPHGRIKIINHSMIIPAQYLPTFNSRVIEAFLHHIPDLTPNYLYMNDDFLFLSPKNKYFFIDHRNIPYKFYLKSAFKKTTTVAHIRTDEYDFMETWDYNNYFLNRVLGKIKRRCLIVHGPKMFNKFSDRQLEERLKHTYLEDHDISVFEKTARSRFRKNDNLQLNVLIKNYLSPGSFKPVKVLDVVVNNKFSPNNVTHLAHYDFLCIQSIDDDSIDVYHHFMNRLFPHKSTFEI